MAIAISSPAPRRVSAEARENFLASSQHFTKNEPRAGPRALSIILSIVSFLPPPSFSSSFLLYISKAKGDFDAAEYPEDRRQAARGVYFKFWNINPRPSPPPTRDRAWVLFWLSSTIKQINWQWQGGRLDHAQRSAAGRDRRNQPMFIALPALLGSKP